jgi:NAD(P)-dependent dehydrogenase (short-subunit alcohol dehydrogenase family)
MTRMAEARVLADRSALVTGGGTGIGLGITRRLLESGAAVTIAARRLEVLEEAAESLRKEIDGATLRTARCDTTVEEDVAAAVAVACEASGRLDIAVANAGTLGGGPLLLSDPAEWARVFQVHVVGSMLTMKHAALAMREAGGSIVAISSPTAANLFAFGGPYGPSKAALETLVQSAALELGKLGVRVNAIRAGLVATDLATGLMQRREIMERLEAMAVLRLPGSAEEIGNAVVFLSSPGGSWITGQILNVDGGLSIPQGPSTEAAAREALGAELFDRLYRRR